MNAPEMIGSINIDTEILDLVRGLCPCLSENSQDLTEEREQWFKEMETPTWTRPYKSCSEVVIGLKWIESEEVS